MQQRLAHWRQVAAAHADNEQGLPPSQLPFSVDKDADPEHIVQQVAAGQQPYCCPPCRAVFESEHDYLEHQGTSAHQLVCRQVFRAYSGNEISTDSTCNIMKVKGGKPAVQKAKGEYRYCCLACSRLLAMDQFIHHLVCKSHLTKAASQLKAIKANSKRQKVAGKGGS